MQRSLRSMTGPKNITEGTDANVVLLSENGADIHSFSPSARDIVKIAASDLMIYNGGVSDEWVKKVLATTAEGYRQHCDYGGYGLL